MIGVSTASSTLGMVQMRYKKLVIITLMVLVSACEKSGEALYRAVEKCDAEAVERLISNERLAYRDHYGNSVAHIASSDCDDVAIIKKIVEFERNMVFAESNNGSTPLSAAFGQNDYEKVQYLLHMGSEIPHYMRSRLSHVGLIEDAVTSGSKASTIRLLMEHGADVTAASFYAALSFSDARTVSLLLPRLHPEIVNRPDRLDEYPLEIAINRKDPEMLRVLLEAGARTDVRFGSGKTPLQHAEGKGQADLLKIIRSFMGKTE